MARTSQSLTKDRQDERRYDSGSCHRSTSLIPMESPRKPATGDRRLFPIGNAASLTKAASHR